MTTDPVLALLAPEVDRAAIAPALIGRTAEADVVVRAVIRRADGAVLVMQRTLADDFGGQWELPGGGADDDHPLAALVREAEEETGMVVEAVFGLLSTRYFPMEAPHRCYEERIFAVGASGQPVCSDEHDAYAWVLPGQVFDEPMSETTRFVLDTLAS